jgi:putative redox protein
VAEITVNVAQTGPSSSRIAVRHHRVDVDRPVAKGGADRGAMGGELLLGALGGCFMSTLLAAVAARDVGVSDVDVTVRGTLGEGPGRFTAVHLHVDARCDDAAALEKLVAMAERGCLVANTLRGAVDLTVTSAAAATAT